MTTIHEFMAGQSLERFQEDTDGLGVLLQAQKGLREGRWNDEYLDAIGQYPHISPSSWPMEQVAAFIETHVMILGGSVAEVLISVGKGPHRDADREGNAAALARLPHPFRAVVNMTQNNAERDGNLFWDCPIPVTLWTGLIERRPDGSTHPLPVRFAIEPGRAALEIGSTKPSRTLAHLVRSGTLARWPYGRTRLRLFVNLNPETFMSYRIAKAVAPYRKPRA